MWLTMKHFWHFIFGVAVAALSTAYVMQYIFHIMPCELCEYQRLPYIAMIAISMTTFISPKLTSQMLVILLINLAVALLIGIIHIGIEQGWPGFITSCVNNFNFQGSFAEFKHSISQQPIVPCNQVQFYFLGLSLAFWNFSINCLLFVLTIMQMRRHD